MIHLRLAAALLAWLPLFSTPVNGDDAAEVLEFLEPLKAQSRALANYLWENPELGYLEFDAAEKLSGVLENSGFKVERGVSGMPTAFVASYGQGGPVIALLGEMDALPGESQAAVPKPQIVEGKIGAHACGHHLFGPGSAVAAIAISQWLAATGIPGTVRYYAAPAEEGGAGKIYMVRDGLFDDVDIVLHWHAAGVNAAIPVTNSAVKSAKFRFRGVPSHAAVSPERGRSALDAVEVMNYIVNVMREHMSSTARIHYVITSGGDGPTIVPEFAEVYYYVREKNVKDLVALWDRVVKAADAAALGTETELQFEVIHSTYNLLVNHALKKALDANLRQRAPTIAWTDEERAFARQIYATFENPWLPPDTENFVVPFQEMHIPGSSDVGDISWVVPTADVMAMTWVPSTDAHSWQATAAGGTGIGIKGMHMASEVLAMTAVDLFTNPDLMARAKAEFAERRGADFEYQSLVGDMSPPLDFRLEESKGAKR